MMNRGNGNRRRIQLQVRSQQLVHCGKYRNPVLGCGLGCAGLIGLDGRHQADARTRRLQFTVHAQMIAPKGPGAGHSNPQHALAGYFAAPAAPLPSTAWRQRL